jgi:hypothetical protein
MLGFVRVCPIVDERSCADRNQERWHVAQKEIHLSVMMDALWQRGSMFSWCKC